MKIEASLNTLYRGFKKIPFTLYTYVLTKILQNGAKVIQKLTFGFKNHMRNSDNFRQAVESPKSWNLMNYFCLKINLSKKYIPSAKTLYAEDLTFNYLCENSPNYLCHFIIFHDTLLCIFLAQTLHTFNKSSPSMCKFSDFLLLGLSFTKFLMYFSNKVSFPSKFGSLYSIMRDNSSVIF